MSVGRATHNGAARRSCGEWSRLLEDRDRWRLEALEAERALAATTAELADASALACERAECNDVLALAVDYWRGEADRLSGRRDRRIPDRRFDDRLGLTGRRSVDIEAQDADRDLEAGVANAPPELEPEPEAIGLRVFRP
jgi:hypothetical protein